MATIRIERRSMIIELTRAERLEGLHGDVRVPLEAIRQVDVLDRPLEELHGLRAPGLHIPGRTAVGTWRSRDGRTFVVEHHRARAVRFTLSGSPFDQVIVGSEDPEELAATVERARAANGQAS